MKTRKFLWALLPVAAVLLMTACGGDDTDDVTPTPTPNPVTPGTENIVKSVPYTVTVKTADVTRTSVDNDDITLRFEADDKLYVQNVGGTVYGCLTLKAGEGETSATFAGTVNYTGAKPANSTELTATLVGSENLLNMIGTDGKVKGDAYIRYPGTVCETMEEAVKKYSWIRGTGTYGEANFTLVQRTAFMMFSVTLEDGTVGGATVNVVIKSDGSTIGSGTTVTTGSQFDALASFVLPLEDDTDIAGDASMCVANVGTDDESIRIGTGTKVTLEGGNVYPVTRTKDFVRLWANGPVWSTRNLGATNVTDYGDYYQWGETDPVADDESCGWNINYNFWVSGTVSSSDVKFSKYVPTDKSPYWGVEDKDPDGLTTLVASDDAATAKLGSPWRMPTESDFIELKSNTNYDWTTGSVNGGMFSGKEESSYKDKAIFLPAASYRSGTSPNELGKKGHYWSSSLDTSSPWYGRMLYFDPVSASTSNIASRCYGRPVRAIRTN